ncbi:hypothetical protein Axy22_073 [Achromobacter phage vB_AxyP_19-32_Axy22]|uniref:Uncharacterized protein n=1 Tax=Achromobacter phage vB_AxyP_19-32_Axy22 TaxID=2591046 RepID=A0A514CVW4_9CAUD|nr:hypothetical protein Axy22_073 [Achromobacter phage vB_AxyP_19-32_Axy22]
MSEHSHTPSAPKVTEEEVRGLFESVIYVVLPDGRTTIAMGTMKNGFTVRGESSCVCKENFNEKLGEEYAYADMIKKTWPLAGLLLAERLHQEKQSQGETWVDRLLQEYAQTKKRFEALTATLNNPPSFMEPSYLEILAKQRDAMAEYVAVLKVRLDMARQG